MTDVVRVIIRERPTSEVQKNDVVIRHCDSVKNRMFVEDRPFTIGQVFDSKAKQEDVYASIEPLVKKFLEGYSCNVLSYGQSGTGKSFTMGLQSDNFESSDCIGIVPRALQQIMEFAQQPENEITVEISFFEIYNEKVFDLLSDTNEHINVKGSKFTGGVRRQLENLFDAEQILIEGNKNRRTRPTTMNTNSSRSHGIVVIYRKSLEKTENSSSSTFYLVDLAGSEGVRRTGHKGEALAEGSHINRGLLGIGNIFKALSDGSCRVPYRDTVLGSVLQDSLNSNSFSTLVICISALKKDVSETINSLIFAQKVMNSKSNPKILSTLHSDGKKRPTFKKDDSMSTVNQENFETPIAMRRPLAASTAMASRPKFRPAMAKISEIQTPIACTNRPSNPQILDLQNSQLMESPTVKQCFEAMKRTLQKRNIRINSINFSEVDGTMTSGSDNSSLNSTVIQNVIGEEAKETKEAKEPNVESGEKEPNVQNEARVPVANTSEYVTKEDVLRLVEAQIANLTRVQPQQVEVDPVEVEIEDAVPEVDDDSVHSSSNEVEHPLQDSVPDSTMPFEFKIPVAPAFNFTTDRRRSIRIQQHAEKRKSIAPSLPSPPPPPKRRRTTINKKASRESIVGASVSKADHRNTVLNLLNKGDMKAIQVLPQIGMKTAYCIITHRSLNGKFKSFKEVAKAPFWRGKGWERFEKANNLC